MVPAGERHAPAQVPVFEVETAPGRGVVLLDELFPVTDVVSERHVFFGVRVIFLDPTVCNRNNHISVILKQIIEVGLPAGCHPAPPAAPALGEGAGENTGNIGEQVTLEEVGVGKGVWLLDKVHMVRGRADPTGETPPEASEVALCKQARLPVHPGLGSASMGCGAARDRGGAEGGGAVGGREGREGSAEGGGAAGARKLPSGWGCQALWPREGREPEPGLGILTAIGRAHV